MGSLEWLLERFGTAWWALLLALVAAITWIGNRLWSLGTTVIDWTVGRSYERLERAWASEDRAVNKIVELERRIEALEASDEDKTRKLKAARDSYESARELIDYLVELIDETNGHDVRNSPPFQDYESRPDWLDKLD